MGSTSKRRIRHAKNLHNYNLLGNRLDRLFQQANDGCTNGIPIGPVVSDLIAEIVAGGIDRLLTKQIKQVGVDCEVVRFKDDYRILAKTDHDARCVVKMLQAALREYNLELSDAKTEILTLPDGLFREWTSLYHAAQPKKPTYYSWKAFRELYLAVLRIDRQCPGTGVIDRFLADLVSPQKKLKFKLRRENLPKAISMLLLLARLRVKALPKVLGIIETVLRTPFGQQHQQEIRGYLKELLGDLARDEARNRYLLTWLAYFLASNGFRADLRGMKVKDPIVRTAVSNRAQLFTSSQDFKLFLGCSAAAKKTSLLEHLDLFNPPRTI